MSTAPFLHVLTATAAAVAVLAAVAGAAPDATPVPYAPWAHGHWVWLTADDANATSLEGLVASYHAHNISVTAVNCDSTWQTGYETFQFDESRYPDPKAFIDGMHAQSIRVVFWITSMVNNDSSVFAEGLAKGYYLRDAFNQNDPLSWWHGKHKGHLLDYTNPDAVEWWHGLMAAPGTPIALGADGWKTDGTDPYLMEYVEARGYKGRAVHYRQYADLYYGDFWNFTRARLGDDRLIMSRPVDGFDWKGILIPLAYSPRDVVFSGWVGDQDPTFEGLQAALKRYFLSAWAGYVGWGSDTGGYRRSAKRTAELFMRWAGVGAFSSLFENGGDGNHLPWVFDKPGSTAFTDTYRRYVDHHLMLGPYLLSAGTEAFYNNHSIYWPLANKSSILDLWKPDTWQYLLGKDVLVAPVVEEGATTLNVTFPKTAAVWVDFWDPNKTYAGGSSHVLPAPLTTMLAFHRGGAVVPLNVTLAERVGWYGSGGTGLVLLLVRPRVGARQTIYRWKRDPLHVQYVGGGGTEPLTVAVEGLGAHETATLLVQGLGRAPAAAASDGAVHVVGHDLVAVRAAGAQFKIQL